MEELLVYFFIFVLKKCLYWLGKWWLNGGKGRGYN